MNEAKKDNIFKITDRKGTFKGTGFLLTEKYIVTCHHCIYDINEIYADNGSKKYNVKWEEEFSCMEKDIAFLRVAGIHAKPLESRRQIFGGLDVYIWGYSGETISTFRYGGPVPGKLDNYARNIYFEEDKKYEGTKKWNKKPAISVDVFMVAGNFDHGHSGSPVFFQINNQVGAMFLAKDEKFNHGYVLPIETILERIYRYYDITRTKPQKASVIPKEISLFVSKPSALNPEQLKVWNKLQEVLANIGISIRFLKPEDYRQNIVPIAKVKKALEKSHGVIVLGLKQTRVIKGISKVGSANAKLFNEHFLPTPWNHIEDSMAFMLNIPVLMINEGVEGGIFDTNATDFIIHEVKIGSEDWWRSEEFMQHLNEWLRDVLDNYKSNRNKLLLEI
jgi:hypothetical protein